MMDSPDDITGPVNLGNPTEISILNLAQKIIQLTNSKSKIVFNSLPEDDPKRRCPDISKAKNILRWQAETKIDEGLKATITYFVRLLEEGIYG